MLLAGGCFGRGELRTAAAESEFFDLHTPESPEQCQSSLYCIVVCDGQADRRCGRTRISPTGTQPPEPNYAKANIYLRARGIADRRCGIGIFLTYILLKARSGAKAAFIALLFATDKRTAAAEQKC